MTSHSLSFAPEAPTNVVYTLLELPSDLLSLVESTLQNPSIDVPLVIKGQADDDAVLCTRDRTHQLRACVNSNSLLLCQPAPVRWDDEEETAGEGTAVEVVATLHQTLECTATRARTERLDDLLGDYLWTGEEEAKPSKRIRRYSRQDVIALVQASEAELDKAFDDQRILEVDGYMRRASPQILSKYLSALLATFTGNSLNASAFCFDPTAETFAEETDLDAPAARQILRWFSRPSKDQAGMHELDMPAIAKEIGIALLENWQFAPQKAGVPRHSRVPLNAFLEQWRESMTEAYQETCQRSLLDGHHIYGEVPEPHLLSIPAHSLPLEPQARFAHLFSLRQKWTPEEMTPFLKAISLNDKERERWVLKYARKVKDGKTGGTLWVSRSATTS